LLNLLPSPKKNSNVRNQAQQMVNINPSIREKMQVWSHFSVIIQKFLS